MRRCGVCFLVAAALAAAQQQTTPAADCAVSGVVKDAGTGKPLANYNVSTYVNVTWLGDNVTMANNSKQVNSVTDEQGRYRLTGLPPGPYSIMARSAESFGSISERRVTLAGQDLDGIDFNVKVNGTISGKVTDENREPTPGIRVYLVSPEYYSGVLGYFLKNVTNTDDRGQYTLSRGALAGHAYLVMAEKLTRRMPAHSETPLDPRLRRRAPMRTYFPNSSTREGASPIVLRPGEQREGVDIEMKRTQNYCVSGTLAGPAGPAALMFGIEPVQPASGMSSTGGMMGRAPGGGTGRDGKFRVCDLNPGVYRLTAFDHSAGPNQPAVNYAIADLSILDQDLANIRLTVSPGLTLDGDVALDGPVPPDGISTKVSLSLGPLLRSALPGERPYAKPDIPGTFSLTGLLPADYALRVVVNAPGFYVKETRYASNDVLHEPLHMGTAPAGTGLHITVARDGATFSARVINQDGLPVPAINILTFPAEVSSEAMLQATLSVGQTDQLGQYTSHTFPPGKYYSAATEDAFDATPDSIGRLWRARNRFQEVELAPNGSAQLQLEPVKIQ